MYMCVVLMVASPLFSFCFGSVLSHSSFLWFLGLVYMLSQGYLWILCFVVDGGSSAPNKGIVRFWGGAGEIIYPFVHIFLKIF